MHIQTGEEGDYQFELVLRSKSTKAHSMMTDNQEEIYQHMADLREEIYPKLKSYTAVHEVKYKG